MSCGKRENQPVIKNQSPSSTPSEVIFEKKVSPIKNYSVSQSTTNLAFKQHKKIYVYIYIYIFSETSDRTDILKNKFVG